MTGAVTVKVAYQHKLSHKLARNNAYEYTFLTSASTKIRKRGEFTHSLSKGRLYGVGYVVTHTGNPEA